VRAAPHLPGLLSPHLISAKGPDQQDSCLHLLGLYPGPAHSFLQPPRGARCLEKAACSCALALEMADKEKMSPPLVVYTIIGLNLPKSEGRGGHSPCRRGRNGLPFGQVTSYGGTSWGSLLLTTHPDARPSSPEGFVPTARALPKHPHHGH
jgi:hypothetical protein